MITENFRKKLMSDAVSPHGYVIIYDQNNKILVDKHNLILPAGREYLFRLFAQAQKLQGVIPTDDTEDYELNYISSACFTDQASSASFDVIPNPSNANFRFDIDSTLFSQALATAVGSNEDSESTSSNLSVNIKKGIVDQHNYLLFSFKIPGEELRHMLADTAESEVNTNTSLSTLYLLLDKEVEGMDAIGEIKNYGKAFSQIVFDSIPLINVEELNVDYYVYF